ncbi:MAG TPA: hypothetical protein VN702_02385 [Acetobacteraceae bacterium]|nr:hypothetical protein [Acetobacteraceae bacterium]
MNLADTLLVVSFRHRIREPDIYAGLARFGEILGHDVDEGEFRDAVSAAIAAGQIHDPVRLPPGALQCHWHLELTPKGVVKARTLLASAEASPKQS